MNPVQSGPAQMGGRTDGQLKMRKNMRTPLAYIIFWSPFSNASKCSPFPKDFSTEPASRQCPCHHHLTKPNSL